MGLQGVILANDQIWLGTPPIVLKYIFVFFHFTVCKIFVLILISGIVKECFWQYVSLKNCDFFWLTWASGLLLLLWNCAHSLVSGDLQNHVNTLINETNIKYEATTLSMWDIAIELEELQKTCQWAAICLPLVYDTI